jgi:hypothetical protein
MSDALFDDLGQLPEGYSQGIDIDICQYSPASHPPLSDNCRHIGARECQGCGLKYPTTAGPAICPRCNGYRFERIEM